MVADDFERPPREPVLPFAWQVRIGRRAERNGTRDTPSELRAQRLGEVDLHLDDAVEPTSWILVSEGMVLACESSKCNRGCNLGTGSSSTRRACPVRG